MVLFRLRYSAVWSAATLLAAPTLVSAQGGSKEVPTRDQIPDKYKWDLSVIYADQAAWEVDFGRVEEMIERLAKRKGTLGQSPKDLLATLQAHEETSRVLDRLVVYAHQNSDLNTGDNEALGLKSRSVTLNVKFSEAVSWIDPELLTLPEETLRSWCKTEAKLAVYEHYIDNVIRQKAHTLSAREEELLAMAGEMAGSPANAYNVLNNAELVWPTVKDEDGREVTLSHARYNKFIRSTNRDVRRGAFMAQMKAFKSVENTMAALLSGAVQRDIYYARARGFESSLEAALFPDNLPPSVFRNLVKTINANLPVLHRWAAMRKKALKLDELHVYDLYQPIVEGKTKEIEYDDAVEKVIAALPILGDVYCKPMKEGFESRWIDVYETKGKR
ncbi:MAG: oligoendopeptidase F, partial [Planctomycetes bacterium]|nr:oligoendopeptidase F [Planctomycetota bacterium]